MVIASDRGPVLQAIDVAKSYGGVHALRGATLELCAGEVHGLVGENGAGKSTLIKILTGAVRPDAGKIVVEGRPLMQHSPRAAKAQGIAAIYQQPALFPELSVAENLATGVEPHRARRAPQSIRPHARCGSTPVARFSATLSSGNSAGCW